jgi:hypothetical protein
VSGPLWATNLEASCAVREVEYAGGYQFDAWKYAVATNRFGTISPTDEFGLPCPQHFWIWQKGKTLQSGFTNISEKPLSAPPGFALLQVNQALVEINLSFTPLRFLWKVGDRIRFVASRTSGGSMKWRRAGPEESILVVEPERARHVLQRCKDPKLIDGYEYTITIQTDMNFPPPGCKDGSPPQ